MTAAPLAGLSSIADDYDAILCDVWGVVHNGIAAHHSAADALAQFRALGKPAVLVTNAPRPAAPIIAQLNHLGVRADAYDHVVSSGDVVRQHLKDARYQSIYYIGPSRDHPLFEGVTVTFTEDAGAADAIVVTDLRSDDHMPDDYREELRALVPSSVPFISANPDVVVERGGNIVYCGGALAQMFDDLGGSARQFGKPHRPIYDRALEVIAEAAPGAKRILAIGDGLPTDITGANRHGLDVLFITDGIHAHEIGVPGAPDHDKLHERLGTEGLTANHYMPKLAW
ncbi:MAG: TIGR01459 family HAD-type hydrolase [Pseudomonadota bacterium]